MKKGLPWRPFHGETSVKQTMHKQIVHKAIHLSRNSHFRENHREKGALQRCVKKISGVNTTLFAWVSLGKVGFISCIF